MKLLTFLLISVVMLVATDLYFEYMVSRPFPAFLTTLAGVLLIVGFFYYMKYAAKTLKNLLDL